jgi:hypothetical protein
MITCRTTGCRWRRDGDFQVDELAGAAGQTYLSVLDQKRIMMPASWLEL